MLTLGVEVRQHWPEELVRLLDDSILLAVGSHELFILAITAQQRVIGFESAIDLALRLEADLVPETGSQRTSYIEILRRMYLNYLQLFLDEQDAIAGWNAWDRARDRFPDDPEIHLRGVELALLEANWQEAENIIDQRVYPLGLADREKLLRAKIAELKGLEGKIVIRFQPGARLIPTTARLNRRFDQDFLIDTGASLTTIPRAMLDRLNIPITADTPRRRVATAGGEVIAHEVTLPVIEIGGWEVNDLQVLVLDLPGQGNLGLLGLNYLKNFRMDLKTNDGVLVLEPL